MTIQTTLSKNDPLITGWEDYKNSPEYDNSFKWAENDEPLAQCSICLRKTYAPRLVNQRCMMIQPNGIHCGGIFQAHALDKAEARP